jgi:hypothetical protein
VPQAACGPKERPSLDSGRYRGAEFPNGYEGQSALSPLPGSNQLVKNGNNHPCGLQPSERPEDLVAGIVTSSKKRLYRRVLPTS